MYITLTYIHILFSPAVVGNLWDVTDRSIDRLTKYTLKSWGLIKTDNIPAKPKSLVQAVTESRSQCKLPYLIGKKKGFGFN